jgi:cyanate permease
MYNEKVIMLLCDAKSGGLTSCLESLNACTCRTVNAVAQSDANRLQTKHFIVASVILVHIVGYPQGSYLEILFIVGYGYGDYFACLQLNMRRRDHRRYPTMTGLVQPDDRLSVIRRQHF